MHTPTPGPWRVIHSEGRYHSIIVGKPNGEGIPIVADVCRQPEAEINAALICRAVNAHPELVKALEPLGEMAAYLAKHNPDAPDNGEISITLGQLRSIATALSLAKGEGK